MKQLYIDINARFAAELPAIKYCALYNNQLVEAEHEKTFNYPAALIELADFSFIDMTMGVQRWIGTIRMHLAFKTYKPEDSLDILDVVDSVSKKFHLWMPTEGSPFVKQAESQDVNHSNLYVYILEFKTAGTDSSNFINDDLVEQSATLDLTSEIIIQNDILRTAKDFS